MWKCVGGLIGGWGVDQTGSFSTSRILDTCIKYTSMNFGALPVVKDRVFSIHFMFSFNQNQSI